MATMAYPTPSSISEYLQDVRDNPDRYLLPIEKVRKDAIEHLETLANHSDSGPCDQFLQAHQFRPDGERIHPVTVNNPLDSAFDELPLLCMIEEERYNAMRLISAHKLEEGSGSLLTHQVQYKRDALEGIYLNFLKQGDVEYVSLVIEMDNTDKLEAYHQGMWRNFTNHEYFLTIRNPAPGFISFGEDPIQLDSYFRYTILVKYSSNFGVKDHFSFRPRHIGIQHLLYTSEMRNVAQREVARHMTKWYVEVDEGAIVDESDGDESTDEVVEEEDDSDATNVVAEEKGAE
jgi:hypothetical protein